VANKVTLVAKGAKAQHNSQAHRRQFIQYAAGAGLAVVSAPFSRFAHAQRPPIKIGVLAPLSGVFSSLGTHKVEGIKLFFAGSEMKIGNRPVELLVEDDAGKPQEGLRQARKLVESEEVDILLGVLSSAVGYAVKDYANRAKRVWVTTGAAADGIFKKSNKSRYAFRSSLSTWQGNNPMGNWLASQKVERVLLTGQDYSMGHEAADAFRGAFEVSGPKIENSVFAPVGTSDFAPFLAEIKRKEPQVVYATYAGSDAVRFVQQYKAFGLADTIPLTGYGYIAEEDVIEAAGEATKGIRSGLNWAHGIDSAENKDFVARYHKAYNTVPTVDSVAGYVGAQVVHAAIESLNGDISSQEQLSDALSKVRINTPRGTISFDLATNNVVQNIYVREVANVDGALHNKVLATYTDVRDPGD
jgi:branched-chain amino acid transport system substrate-binding protein